MAQSSNPDPSLSIHIPVLLDEAIRLLAPVDGGIFVDGTLGLGGHTEKILKSCSPSGRVIGFEWDASALELAQKRLAPFGKRFYALHRNYSEIMAGLAEIGIHKVDGLLLDLGVSSLQFDSGERGFSFQTDGPLDMRMDRREHLSAEKIINDFSKEELADIFYYYGEERQARRIAAHIIEERAKDRITSTSQLARIVAGAVPKKFQPRKIHVATKVFQALRIAVNKELDNLTDILDTTTKILKPAGRVCIITFHSLEDRLVKWKFKDNPELHVLTKKPVIPGEDEIKINPRARSAKLRAAYMKG
ncbi:MAG: 16S rRNA (cytosine(1402)-N(4))-methyltransferase RsmH [Deltaproteobacteria bacterium]|jgi:16S rRNA (cytosine1402-N4)-methyltransferase|nr:MAG: 16S rRNA (cytosine(1402)-N(4))-methyltransferase RsmH [Deltaproteobacteria bacterium]